MHELEVYIKMIEVMKRYKYLVGWWMLLALLASCNESLKTYSDYAGDGKIRYQGSVSICLLNPVGSG